VPGDWQEIKERLEKEASVDATGSQDRVEVSDPEDHPDQQVTLVDVARTECPEMTESLERTEHQDKQDSLESQGNLEDEEQWDQLAHLDPKETTDQRVSRETVDHVDAQEKLEMSEIRE